MLLIRMAEGRRTADELRRTEPEEMAPVIRAVLERTVRRGEQAEQRLIEALLPEVVGIARRFPGPSSRSPTWRKRARSRWSAR